MKKKLAISILLVAILLGAISMTALVMRNNKQSLHSVSHSSSSHKQESYEKTIELDQVYKEENDDAIYYDIFKSDGTYISIQDRASIYKSETDLDKAGNEEEARIFPNIYYNIGTYKFNGDNIEYKIEQSTEIYFNDVKTYKRGKYYTIKHEHYNQRVIWKKGKKGYYINGALLKFQKSNYVIPNSEEEFLTQYTYDPSTRK
ncbi:Uncharacterised protein [Streptococcus criceti]|uniref:Uncharacterized protein n=1 Tax=Streptococcus criceti HS-6 TaxID=873449 RepID=G5JN97_STRCG|nr:hypothetical protein [Streptococcus criceti]EHI75100.1 hypothetical protein STRCR_0134 [Streptococcus criceti HS-6]SUN41647.1 Uncharacterised protein [Streptococcus criceti]